MKAMGTRAGVPVALVCWAALVIVWLVDLFSPQVLVVSILLSVPVALSLAAGNPSLTLYLTLAALAGDASAGWFNGFQDHFHWQVIALADRALTALAIALVGAVTISALLQSEAVRRLGERNARSELMRDLIFALAHDLRTPLTAAKITLHQALEGAYGDLPSTYRDIVQQSIVSNEELTTLAETLLSLARYEAGEQSQRREPVDVGELCRNVAESVRPLCQFRRIALTCRTPEEPLTVDGDGSELRRALTNLAANAANWTPKGGTVSIEAYAAGKIVVVRVDDDGYGVPDDLREHMFERFVGRVRSNAGTGLGLYIVRRIVESHSGSVQYEPRSPRGSTFTVTLPLAQNVQAA
ncbi:MAG TPA: HAMP domain-containing sensor histidine kinase [Candidatus Baltobacteraceae bacterium]|nr:HAMP domain-containing sensor histidine kinase [Candidatus Baltobacteraceae bacterium]